MTRTDTIPTLRLRNSLTRLVEDFAPIDPTNVRLYLCGPTVYDRAHLGNARNVILFDLLTRLLRHDYGADQVTYVRNVTDVEDKINDRAAETGREIRDITDETLGWFHDDMGALGNLPPDHEPRATDYIGEMVEMIEGLIASGNAYAAEGHVLFAVGSYDGYGKLSGRSLDDMIAGARVEVAPYKRDPMDFVLWKPSGDDEPGWETSLGYGRPGWHIECSAMSKAILGPSFDIHGGGNDLLFPHHENERAQSCCADPDASFAQVWLHNEMLLVEGKKMSKSLGNFFTVRDLLDKGVPGEVIRFVFLSTHYSKPMDWTDTKAREAKKTLRKWRTITDGVEPSDEIDDLLLDYLRDDLNSPQAITEMHRLYASAIDYQGEGRRRLKAAGLILGLLHDDMGQWTDWQLRPKQNVKEQIERLMSKRYLLRGAKDWEQADKIRDALLAAGVEVREAKTSYTYDLSDDFDPSKLPDPLKFEEWL